MTNHPSTGEHTGPIAAPAASSGELVSEEVTRRDPSDIATAPSRRMLGLAVPGDWKVAVGVYVWVQLVLLGWWAGQFPGYLSYDSTVYVTHVTTGPWTADHSVLYDLLVKISIHLSGGIWLLTLGQTVVWSLAIVYFVRSVQMWGVKWYWAAIPAVVLPFAPSIGGVASTVWKDSAFAWAELLLAASLLRLLARWPLPVRTPSRLRRKARARFDAAPPATADPARTSPVPWGLLLLILLELLLVMLFRNDGFLMVLVIAVVLVAVVRGLRLRLLAVSVAALVGWIFATTVIYPAAGIKPAQSSLAYGTFYSDIAVVYRWAPGSFTAQDRAVMRRVAPLNAWRDGGRDCFNGDYLRLEKHYRKAAADTFHTQLAKIWIRALARTPVAVVKSRLCRAAIAWDPVAEPWPRAGAIVLSKRIDTTYFGRASALSAKMRRALKPRPLSNTLGTAAYQLRKDFDGRYLQDIVWRGALWCYVAYLALAFAAVRRRQWRLVAVGGLVCVANQLMVMAANPVQLFRYILGPIAIGILLVPIAFGARPMRRNADAGVPGDEPAQDEPA